MKTLTGHRGCVNDVAFSPDGRFIASAGNDSTLRVWDTHTGESNVLVKDRWLFQMVAFTADASHVLARPWDGGLEVWPVARRSRRTTLIPTLHSYPGGLTVAKGGLVAANHRPRDTGWNVVGVWDTTTWTESVLCEGWVNRRLTSLAFDPTGKRLATGVGVFEVASGRRLVKKSFSGTPLLWSPTTPLLVGGRGSTVVVRDADTGAYVTSLRTGKQVQDAAFSPDGRHLAVVSNEEVVRVWDTRSWKEHSCLAWGIGKLKSVAFAPDGARAACGGHRGEIVIWDWEF